MKVMLGGQTLAGHWHRHVLGPGPQLCRTWGSHSHACLAVGQGTEVPTSLGTSTAGPGGQHLSGKELCFLVVLLPFNKYVPGTVFSSGKTKEREMRYLASRSLHTRDRY